jgi:hypothetical protein
MRVGTGNLLRVLGFKSFMNKTAGIIELVLLLPTGTPSIPKLRGEYSGNLNFLQILASIVSLIFVLSLLVFRKNGSKVSKNIFKLRRYRNMNEIFIFFKLRFTIIQFKAFLTNKRFKIFQISINRIFGSERTRRFPTFFAKEIVIEL